MSNSDKPKENKESLSEMVKNVVESQRELNRIRKEKEHLELEIEQERNLEERKSIKVIWTKEHWKKLISCLPDDQQIIVNKWFVFKEDIIFFQYKKATDSFYCDITFRPSVIEDKCFDDLVQNEIKNGTPKAEVSNEIDSGLEIIYSLSKKEKEIFAILEEDKLMPETDDETIKRFKRY